jgi:hypothetical protein
MKRLMAQFSLKTEEEVVLGRAVVWHPLLNGDRSSLHREKTGLRIRIQVLKLHCTVILEVKQFKLNRLKNLDFLTDSIKLFKNKYNSVEYEGRFLSFGASLNLSSGLLIGSKRHKRCIRIRTKMKSDSLLVNFFTCWNGE